MAFKVWGGRHLTVSEQEVILEETKIARFCCLNDDGTIHATPVWFKYEDRTIVIITPDDSQKARNVKHNNNVTLLIDIDDPPQGVLIYGTAQPENAFDLESTAIAICEKYMSKEDAQHQWRSVCPPTTNWLKITVTSKYMTSFIYES